MAEIAKELLELFTALEDLRLSVYIDTASCAIFIYDYMLTFEDERTLIWPRKWAFLKVLFFMVRYLPIIDLVITAASQFMMGLSAETCSFMFKTGAWLINLGIVTAEAILIIRTYGIWKARRPVLLALIAWAVANLIPDLLVMHLFLKSIGCKCAVSVMYFDLEGLSGCLVTSGNDLLIGVWIILMIYEMVLVILLAIKGYQMYKELGRTSLYLAMFRDGAIFYVYIFVLSAANVVVLATLHNDKAKYGMLAGIERVAHSVLTGRLLLTLYKATKQEEIDDLQTMQFEEGPALELNSVNGVSSTLSLGSA